MTLLLPIFALFFLLSPVTSYLDYRGSHKSRISRGNIVCVNGEIIEGECRCNVDFVGKYCEKQMHCDTWERSSDGACSPCVEGFTGPFCEEIICQHGKVDSWGTGCTCDPPYQGQFCEELETEKTYSFYNNRAKSIGPLGALALIPMCFIYWFFERKAKNREMKKKRKQLEEYQESERKKQLMVSLGGKSRVVRE